MHVPAALFDRTGRNGQGEVSNRQGERLISKVKPAGVRAQRESLIEQLRQF